MQNNKFFNFIAVNKKLIIRLFLLVSVFALLLGAYLLWSSQHPPIRITSDSYPVSIEFGNNKTYYFKKGPSTIRPSKNIYKYRAFTNNNRSLSLYGAVDTIEYKSENIDLAFDIYNLKKIKKDLCGSVVGCTYYDKISSVKFYDDHTWAIVTLDTVAPGDDFEKGYIALKRSGYKWVKVAGPVINIEGFRGIIPTNIVEAVSQ